MNAEAAIDPKTKRFVGLHLDAESFDDERFLALVAKLLVEGGSCGFDLGEGKTATVRFGAEVTQ